jgi:small multidrug resistance pump
MLERGIDRLFVKVAVFKRRSQMNQWLVLGGAFNAEVVATSALKASDGFSKLIPSLVTVAGYAIAFYLLSLTLRTMPVGIAYAIWAGAGTILIGAVAWIWYGQKLDLAAVIGMALIVSGVIVLNVFSKSAAH